MFNSKKTLRVLLSGCSLLLLLFAAGYDDAASPAKSNLAANTVHEVIDGKITIPVSIENLNNNEICLGQVPDVAYAKSINYNVTSESGRGIFAGLKTSAQAQSWSCFVNYPDKISHTWKNDGTALGDKNHKGNYYLFVGSSGTPLKNIIGTITLEYDYNTQPIYQEPSNSSVVQTEILNELPLYSVKSVGSATVTNPDMIESDFIWDGDGEVFILITERPLSPEELEKVSEGEFSYGISAGFNGEGTLTDGLNLRIGSGPQPVTKYFYLAIRGETYNLDGYIRRANPDGSTENIFIQNDSAPVSESKGTQLSVQNLGSFAFNEGDVIEAYFTWDGGGEVTLLAKDGPFLEEELSKLAEGKRFRDNHEVIGHMSVGFSNANAVKEPSAYLPVSPSDARHFLLLSPDGISNLKGYVRRISADGNIEYITNIE